MTPPTGTLRVAAVQAESVPGDVTANVATAVGLVEEAGQAGARLVVLPELFLTGYDPAVWSPPVTVTAEDGRLDPLREVAERHEVAVVASAAVARAGTGRPTLSVLAVGPDGLTTTPYDKQHLSGVEKEHFAAGDRGASLSLDGWELGLGICYDGCFPEHAGAAVAAGAQAYLCPAAYYGGGEHRRDLYYAARALDNGVYVVLAGLTGRCGDGEFSGGSAVYEPEGRPLGRVGAGRGLVLADLDPAEVQRVRSAHPMAQDRAEQPDRWEPRRRVALG